MNNKIITAVLMVAAAAGVYYVIQKPNGGTPQNQAQIQTPANNAAIPSSSTTVQPPPLTVVKPATTTYTTLQGGFSVIYPRRFPVTNLDTERRMQGSVLGRYYREAGMLGFIGIYIPDSEFPRTNFSEAELNFSATGARPCNVARHVDNPLTAAGTRQIDGRKFSKYTADEGAAGNLYQTTIYTRGEGDRCFVIEEIIHSTRLGNYDPSLGVRQYNERALRKLLDGVINGFKVYH